MPHFRGIRHDLEESLIKIWNVEVIPTVTEGIEKKLEIQRGVVHRMLLESTKDFL